MYLRSKDDHKSCTPAGAKLTDEYTHRNNKNNPSTISVTPPQLCTFFRKRTGRWRKLENSSVDMLDYLARKRKILPNFDFFLPNFHFSLPNFYFGSLWGIFVCSLTFSDFLVRKETNSKMSGRTLWHCHTFRF